MNQSHRISVAVVDQHATFTDCLAVVMEMRHYQFHVVPWPSTPEALISQLQALGVDVVLLSVNGGQEMRGAAVVGALARLVAPVVALTDDPDDTLHGECLGRGARAVLSKDAPLATLMSVLRKVSRGEPVATLAERERLVGLARARRCEVTRARARLGTLTCQEIGVLRHLMEGRTACEIAQARGVAEATVRSQIKAVLRKLEVSSQLAAVAFAYRAGWPARDLSVAS